MKDNKIRIPWYRRTVKATIAEDENQTNPFDFGRVPINIPRVRPRTVTVPEPKPAPQPSTVKAPQPNPVNAPVAIPDFAPNPGPVPGGVPVPTPPLPIPPLLPAPDENKYRNPLPPMLPSPNPSINFTPEQVSWGERFITDVELVGYLTGVGSQQVYQFLVNYDYSNLTVAGFHKAATDEFGATAATILSVLIVGKGLAQLWGKRATSMFSPPINVDDDYFKEYFYKNDNSF